VGIKKTSHGPFEEARAIDANSPAVTEWVGEPSTDVLDRIKSGVLARVDFNREAVPEAAVAALGRALGSEACRLLALMMKRCTYPGGVREAWAVIGDGLARNASVVEVK
jgi:hypothetical protein